MTEVDTVSTYSKNAYGHVAHMVQSMKYGHFCVDQFSMFVLTMVYTGQVLCRSYIQLHSRESSGMFTRVIANPIHC